MYTTNGSIQFDWNVTVWYFVFVVRLHTSKPPLDNLHGPNSVQVWWHLCTATFQSRHLAAGPMWEIYLNHSQGVSSTHLSAQWHQPAAVELHGSTVRDINPAGPFWQCLSESELQTPVFSLLSRNISMKITNKKAASVCLWYNVFAPLSKAFREVQQEEKKSAVICTQSTIMEVYACKCKENCGQFCT